MIKALINSLFSCFIVLLLHCSLAIAPPAHAQEYTIKYIEHSVSSTGEIAEEPIDFGVSVTATVPSEWWLELQGWTSPWAKVELTMEQIVKKETRANDQGEFVFRVALPRSLAPFCLIATDTSETTSHPLCIATPPPTEDILIKEVVMPPTLKINKGKLARGETVAAEGYTTPDSEVSPYLFEEKSRKLFPFSFPSLFTLLSPIYAAEVPKFPVKSDQNGFFQFNLPSETVGKNRLFVGSTFLNSPSPKSTTLVFNVLSWWRMILERIWAFITNLLALLLSLLTRPEVVILIEVGVILVIGYLLIVKRKKRPTGTSPVKD